MANRILYHTIAAAKAGDSEAMMAIVRHYASYITAFSKRPYYDEYGNRCDFVDEEIRQRIEAKLMFQIIYKFDLCKLPSGETLQTE